MQDDGITVLVPLSKTRFKGEFAFIDIDDAERILASNWSKHSGGYAYRMVGRQCILLHREVLGLPVAREPLVDHVNRNKLDCRKRNLRAGTKRLNAANSKVRTDNSSGYRGVIWRKDTQRWAAQIHVNGRHRALGCFSDPIEAALAYDAAARIEFGEFASLNFPEH